MYVIMTLHYHISLMKMRDKLPCFASSLNEMAIVHSKMAPLQVMHSMCDSTKESSSNFIVIVQYMSVRVQ